MALRFLYGYETATENGCIFKLTVQSVYKKEARVYSVREI